MSGTGDFPDNLIARRLGGKNFGKNGGYKFAGIKKARAEALKLYPERPLLDFGVGEPDGMADISYQGQAEGGVRKKGKTGSMRTTGLISSGTPV